MKFTFNTDLLPEHANNKEQLHSSYPNMFIFVKNVDDIAVVCGVQSTTGSQRCILDDEATTNIRRFNTKYLLDEAELAIEKGATHLITGYYDIIQEEFKNEQCFELENTHEFFLNLANTVIRKQYNEMYFNRELFEANINYRDRTGIKLSLDTDIFDHITNIEVYKFINLYVQTKDQSKFKDEHIFYEKLVFDFIEHFKIKKDAANSFLVMQMLTASEFTIMAFYDNKKDVWDYLDGSRGEINLHEVFKGGAAGENVYPLIFMNERFLNLK